MADLLHAASVRHAWDETRALRGLRLEVPSAVRQTHERPGQYVKVRAGERDGFFALASAPGAPIELLVKRGSPLGDAVAALEEGGAIATSEVAGRGYPVDAQRGRDLLLFAAGSGIVPIRAVIGHLLERRGDFGAVTLFYGHRAPSEFAYRAEHDAWAKGGIELVPVVSRPAGHAWTGATGHVQDALLARRPPVGGAAAFLCGMKGMVEGVSAALVTLGLPREQIFLNH